jgi:hypothetical protein
MKASLWRVVALAAGLLWVPAASLQAADCNRNGQEDYAEASAGLSADCDGNWVPDDCDVRPVNFALAPRADLPLRGQALAAADLDGDGLLDLAV